MIKMNVKFLKRQREYTFMSWGSNNNRHNHNDIFSRKWFNSIIGEIVESQIHRFLYYGIVDCL